MSASPHRRASLLLVLAGGLGLVSALTAPTLTATAWPVGLVTGAALLLGGRGSIVVVAVAAAGVVLGYRAASWPLLESTSTALAHAVGILAVMAILTRLSGRRPVLSSERDIATWAVASLVGGALTGAVHLLVLESSGSTVPGTDALVLGVQHATSQLIFLPWFLTERRPPGAAGRLETGVQVALLAAILAIGAGTDLAVGLGFTVLAVLAWGARRLSIRAILLELVAVALVVETLTQAGLGPFATRNRVGRQDVAWLLEELFLACCALVVVPVVITVGERWRAGREAAQERDRSDALVRSIDSVAIIGTRADGLITSFNPGAEALLGYRAEEVLGRYPDLFFTAAEIERQTAELGVAPTFRDLVGALVREDGEGRPIRFRRSDGVERVHRTRLHPVTGDDGSVVGHVSVSVDITARFEESQALRDAVDRLREIDAAKEALVHGVSHELRTPLTSILGYLEILAEGALGPLTAPQRDSLVRVDAAAHRLLLLVDDLLTVGRISEPSSVVREPVDLTEAVREARELVCSAYGTRDLSCVLDVPEVPVTIAGDRALVERMAVNLIGNAVKFSAEGQRVEVSVRADSTTAELVVRDDGIGIPADEMDHLFSRFFRSRLVHARAIQGSGLGLVIVKGVVDAHDGTIAVESQEGVGTTVCVRLPIAPA